MRRILLGCAILALFTLPAAAAVGASAHVKPGYLVVQRAVGNGGVNGSPAVTLVVLRGGFVLGRVSQEGKVAVYALGSASNPISPQVKGDFSPASVRWHGLPGKQYSGSNFRFRITGGFYRVVVRGSGIYVFAGGRGRVWLQGSSVNRNVDGTYSVDSSTPRSMPTRRLKLQIGRG